MARPALAEITIGMYIGRNPDAPASVIRVLPANGNYSDEQAGTYHLVVADRDVVEAAKQKGEEFPWIDTTEVHNLTAEQLGEWIVQAIRDNQRAETADTVFQLVEA